MEYTIGSQIKKAREEKGMTRAELTKLIGCGRNLVTRWEKGSYVPSLESFKKICEALDTDPKTLLFPESGVELKIIDCEVLPYERREG